MLPRLCSFGLSVLVAGGCSSEPFASPDPPTSGGPHTGGESPDAATQGRTSGGTSSGAGAAPSSIGGINVEGGTSSGGGALATGGIASSGGTSGEAAGGSGADAASASGGAGGGAAGPVCPPGPYPNLPFEPNVEPVRIAGALPDDSFVEENDHLVIVEGPVWIGEALYFSQIDNGPELGFGRPGNGGSGGLSGGGGSSSGGSTSGESGGSTGGSEPKVPPKSRILKVANDAPASIVLSDSGSNGLAVDASGELVLCSHGSGSVERLSQSDGKLTPLVTEYMGVRFNSPNDLAFGPDGSLYFSDPDYQAPSPRPQPDTLVYRVSPESGEAQAVITDRRQPNGLALSPDGSVLYLAASNGLFSYPVLADGTLGAGSPFGAGALASGDGVGMDCEGNLYVATNQSVVVLDPSGAELARFSVPDVQSVTNIAFGGPKRSTLYVTTMGVASRGTSAGVWRVASQIPGKPY